MQYILRFAQGVRQLLRKTSKNEHGKVRGRIRKLRKILVSCLCVEGKKSMLILPFVTAIVLAAADQLLKKIAEANLVSGTPVKVITAGNTDILTFSLYRNTGAAFSSFEGKTVFLIIVTTVMMIALAVWLVKSKPKKLLPVICIAAVLGGGIGNLIDRIFLGYVVDYIILFPFTFIFNFADICVVVGAIILGIYFFFFDGKTEEKHE